MDIANVLSVFAAFLVGAILVESLVGIIGDRFQKIDKTILSMLIGVLVAFYARFNVLTMAGLEFGWNGNEILETVGLVIGIIASGLVLSRGSNGVHDLISKLKSAKELTQAKTDLAHADATVLVDIEDARNLDEDNIG